MFEAQPIALSRDERGDEDEDEETRRQR